MANVKITVEGPLMDGHRVTFQAPCDCTAVEKLDIYYVENGKQVNKLFTMKDTHGNDLAEIGNLFMEGAYVHAILNTKLNVAHLLNADTNSYLESKFHEYDRKNVGMTDLVLDSNFVDMSKSSARYTIKNRICCVYFDITLKAGTGASTIISGTPYPEFGVDYTVPVPNFQAGGTVTTFIPFLNASGIIAYGGVAGCRYLGSVSYAV